MKFSIVIPAMNRQETLDYTIKTIFACNYDDMEIIVHDGASDIPITVPDGVKLFRTDENNSMCSDWNTALSKVTGDYIILFGCDDGILPHSLHDISLILDNMNNPPLLRWNRCYYTWKEPDNYFGEQNGQLQITVGGSSRLLNSKKLISAVARGKMDYTFLPMLYTAAIRHDLLDTLKEKSTSGKILNDISPDIYSGMAFASLVENVPCINKAMTINGGSKKSTGFNSQHNNNEITTDFNNCNDREGLVYDTRVLTNPPLNIMQKFFLNAFYSGCKNGLFDENLLNIDIGTIPAFDGHVLYEKADDVFQASIIAGEKLKDQKFDLDFKAW